MSKSTASRSRHQSNFIAPPWATLRLTTLTQHRQRALRTLTEGAFQDATARLHTILAQRFARPVPSDKGDWPFIYGVELLATEVLKPLLEEVWRAVEVCYEKDDRRFDRRDWEPLYRYGWSWAEQVGEGLGRRFLQQLKHFTTAEQYERAVAVVKDNLPGWVGNAFHNAFSRHVEVAINLDDEEDTSFVNKRLSLSTIAWLVNDRTKAPSFVEAMRKNWKKFLPDRAGNKKNYKQSYVYFAAEIIDPNRDARILLEHVSTSDLPRIRSDIAAHPDECDETKPHRKTPSDPPLPNPKTVANRRS